VAVSCFGVPPSIAAFDLAVWSLMVTAMPPISAPRHFAKHGPITPVILYRETTARRREVHGRDFAEAASPRHFAGSTANFTQTCE
jgi:hypothetical protein